MATRADGSPAVKEKVQVTATANNGRKTLVDRSFTTDRDGKFSVTVDVAKDTNCLKFTVCFMHSNIEFTCLLVHDVHVHVHVCTDIYKCTCTRTCMSHANTNMCIRVCVCCGYMYYIHTWSWKIVCVAH